MNTYELVNPSDNWSFQAKSDKIAFLVALFVGRGATPAERDGWKGKMYILNIGDPSADYESEFKEKFEGALGRHKAEIVESLRTFMIDRRKAPDGLTGKKLKAWNDKRRSSTNDFGRAANSMADALEKANA